MSDSQHDSASRIDPPSGMSTGGAIIGMMLAGLGGFLLRGVVDHGGGSAKADTEIASVPEGAVDKAVERYRVPLGDAPVKGPQNAKVTIVVVSDFQCPFCSRVEATLKQIEANYKSDVRFAWKNNPLPFHPNAMPAAEAAMAANDQGKFWGMHDKIFAAQQDLSAAAYEKYAGELGMDLGKFKQTLASGAKKQGIQNDMAEVAKLGARGTPYFFINGRSFSGAQPYEQFKALVDQEIAAADRAIKAGVKPAQVYAALIKNGKTGQELPTNPQQQAQQQARPDPNQVYKVPVGNSPQKGPQNALVTIVQFSDFQCPFCSRVEPTVTQIEKEYAGKVRVVWKNNPLPFHPNAMPAAEAAMAAGEQGKFWPMHDLLFGAQQTLDPATYEKHAAGLGLNLAKFKASIDAHKAKDSIAADMALAQQLGASGTPSFFINGKNLKGAQPFPAFKTAIDAAIVDAEAALKRGVKPADLYAELTKNGLDKAGAAAPAAPRAAAPSDTTVYKAIVGDAPVRGASDKIAKVTILECSDFQCPFCSRVEPTVDEVLKAYPTSVRIAFKQKPLPFHDKAHLAAEAALAAKEQGRFWEMHAAMFKNQQALDRPSLEKYAEGLGMNMPKFKAALDSGKYKEKVDAEAAECEKIGARGTPSFFVNGKSLVGAQPLESFKAKIDEELKHADLVMQKTHLTGARLYDELIKEGTLAAAPAPQQPAGDQEDKTVYKVEAGSGPSKGPANAPVQIVQFSDFQCPFCSKVEPTVKQIEEKYPGKVRLTWRNYPLPFHPNAMPAAEAAMAAGEQGKFWEMHGKLFANQQALDPATYDKYAQELGLNMGKFKDAISSGRMKKLIEADVEYANKLPGGGMGTPTFFINGHKLAGAYPLDAFAKIIDGELKK